ncbi:MAG TPA: diacylglycerol kinase family protein [Verrucomicrobiae bacterium]|jgi:diacylglycerol kinase family enzyme|nr:diacylglycerol kinase family protein [Verrucomicrobiae bacterium]
MIENPLIRSAVVTCILNGAAGSNRALEARDQIVDLFARHGSEARVLLARNGSEIPDLARRAMAEGSQPVVAGGGDGTLSAVASALVGSRHALGILPLGTLNHFAKDLKIPLELEAAVANLFTGRLARVDVGEVNGRVFLNNSSLGLYPAIVREREERQRHGAGKWIAFALAVVTILWRYAPVHVWLRVDSLPESGAPTPFVFVGNNRYEIEGAHMGGRSRLDGGRLWICRAPHAGLWTLLHLAVKALLGRVPHGGFDAVDGEQCEVRAKRGHLRVSADGEVISLETPLHYRIRPGALGVIVPIDVPSASSAGA